MKCSVVTTAPTCATERAAGIVAALGLIRNLARSAVEMQVGGDPAGLDGHQVSTDTCIQNRGVRLTTAVRGDCHP